MWFMELIGVAASPKVRKGFDAKVDEAWGGALSVDHKSSSPDELIEEREYLKPVTLKSFENTLKTPASVQQDSIS